MGKHIPVLLKEAIDLLEIKDGGSYVDLTLGRAGHSSEILKRIPNGHLYCFDQDETAILESKERLSKIGSNFTLIKANFADVKQKLNELGVTEVDGILADLGVSSPQLDEGSRGFSYKEDAPLDMRMDLQSPLTAREIANTYPLNELTRIIREYGEDKDAYAIAKQIVRRRELSPLETTFDLVECVKKAKSQKALSAKGHPAKQTFQAFRIEVNHEEETLEKMLEDAPLLLRGNGVLAIITFMSLDDRLVKQRFRSLSVKEGSRNNLPLLPSQIEEAAFVDLTKKPIVPSELEVEENHRSVSAKLRGIKRK